jgi:hypothetical protein
MSICDTLAQLDKTISLGDPNYDPDPPPVIADLGPSSPWCK